MMIEVRSQRNLIDTKDLEADLVHLVVRNILGKIREIIQMKDIWQEMTESIRTEE